MWAPCCALAMAFYVCLSRKKAFPGLPQALPKCPRASEASKSSETYQHRNCFPLDFGEPPKPDKPGARDGLGVHLQWVALWACSRWAVPPACRAKGYFEAPWGCSRSSFPPCLSRKRPSQVSPRRCRSALGLPRLWKFPSLSTSFCFPSDFGELPKLENSGLPKPDSPGARDGLRTRVRWTAFSECS